MQRRTKPQQLATIRVVGVGGGGQTAVNRLIAAGVQGVDFITIDTDVEALGESKAPLQVRLGPKSSRHGTDGDPELGRRIAVDAAQVLRNALFGSDMVFVLAGLGGGTGTGAAPILAEVAREQDAVVVAIVTTPYSFEGPGRLATARQGVALLKKATDTLIAVPNERLLQLTNGEIPFHETYRLAHRIWFQSVQSISELVNRSGLINVDFADVRTIFSEGGAAVIATGRGHGPARAKEAAGRATRSDLLGVTIDGARGVLFNITGGPDMSLLEVKEAAAIVKERAHREVNLKLGAAVDEGLGDEVRITVIATGFDASQQAQFTAPAAEPPQEWYHQVLFPPVRRGGST